jgi:hypothetical protein
MARTSGGSRFASLRDRLDQLRSTNAASCLAVAQEHALGCAVACVASRCGVTYARAHWLFATKENAWVRGYYCSEVVDALARAGYRYAFESFVEASHSTLLERPGTIVFVGPCARYPAGHFLIRWRDGWMNSWLNYPQMIPIEAGFASAVPGPIQFVMFEAE